MTARGGFGKCTPSAPQTACANDLKMPARDERLVGLHVNDCTMFTLDVAHIGGDFPLERRSIFIRHGFVKERERHKLLNIGAFHAACFPDPSRLREIILQHPGCHRRKGRENSSQITSKLRSEWRKRFRNCIWAGGKNGRKDACYDCDTPGPTEISVVPRTKFDRVRT
jgi:hypothetical protein